MKEKCNVVLSSSDAHGSGTTLRGRTVMEQATQWRQGCEGTSDRGGVSSIETILVGLRKEGNTIKFLAWINPRDVRLPRISYETRSTRGGGVGFHCRRSRCRSRCLREAAQHSTCFSSLSLRPGFVAVSRTLCPGSPKAEGSCPPGRVLPGGSIGGDSAARSHGLLARCASWGRRTGRLASPQPATGSLLLRDPGMQTLL